MKISRSRLPEAPYKMRLLPGNDCGEKSGSSEDVKDFDGFQFCYRDRKLLIQFMRTKNVRRLEHAIVVHACGRQFLEHVPVLDDLAIFVQPEDVDTGIFQAFRPDLVTVQDNMIALGN